MPIKLHISNFTWTSIFFGVFATLAHYYFGGNDHIEQLPIIYKTMDASYLIHDFFTNSNSGYSPRYYYANFLSFLGNIFGIPWTFFIGTLCSNVATSFLTYLSGKKLFDSEHTGILAAALVMLIPVVSLGSDQVLYASLFTPTTLVFPLVLLAFYSLLQQKILRCVIVCGTISLFHVLIGFEYGILLLLVFIIAEYLENRKLVKALKNAGLVLIIFVFLLANLIPHIQHSSSIESSVFIEILANFRHPHHYLLSEILTLKEIAKCMLFIATIILIWKKSKAQIQANRYIKYIQILTILLSIAIVLAWTFVELIPSKLVTSMQLLRLLNIGKWIFILLLANYFTEVMRDKKFHPKTVVVILCLLLLIFFSEKSWQKVLLFGLGYSLVLYVVQKKQKVILFAFLLVLTGSILTINFVDIAPIKKYQKNYLSSKFLENDQSLLATFLRQNTPKESLFLTPHTFGFIRTEGQRAIIVDYKAFPFNELAMLEWYQRIEDCYGLIPSEFERNYKDLKDVKILKLSRKYHFNYAILYPETQTEIPVIYANSKYKIIDLNAHAK